MKIVIYKGVSQYQALRVFADELARNLEKMGAKVLVLDFEKKGEEQKLLGLIGNSYDMILSMNGLNADLRISSGEYLHNLVDAPFYAYIVDHPLYHHERLRARLKNYHVFCVDSSYAEYVRKYYPQIQSADIVYQGGIKGSTLRNEVPAAICAMECVNSENEGRMPQEKHPRDSVVFMGTYRDLEEVTNEISMADETVQGVVCGMIEAMLDEPGLTLEASLEKVLLEAGIVLSLMDFADTMNAAHFADKYVRTYYRKLVVKCLVEKGIQVHVYGKNWEKLQKECQHPENLIVHEPVGYLEALQIYREALIVLNIMPWSKNGIHDRLLNAMLSGTLVVSDESTYIKEHFKTIGAEACKERLKDGTAGELQEELVLFSLAHIEELPGCIAALLSNGRAVKKLAENAEKKARLKDTWEQRAEEIYRFAENGNETKDFGGESL